VSFFAQIESFLQHFKHIFNLFHPVVFEFEVAASSFISTFVTSLQGHCLLDALQSQVCLPNASFCPQSTAVFLFNYLPSKIREQH
jgi:hypothetical protein